MSEKSIDRDPLLDLLHSEEYEAARQEAEIQWADQWIKAFDECTRLGIIDGTLDDERSITLTQMQGWLGHYGGAA